MERLKDRLVVPLLFMLGTICLGSCWCMNEEGLALLRFRDRIESDPFGALSNWNQYGEEIDPCSWYGVDCSDGKVVVLNLTDLCLEGTLAPEIGNLVHIKAIILRNNTLSGIIPREIGELKDLEVLDLGYNNFTAPHPLPYNLLRNNKVLTESAIHQRVLLQENQGVEVSASPLSPPPPLFDASNSLNPPQSPPRPPSPPPPPLPPRPRPPPPPPPPPPEKNKKSNTTMVVATAVGVSALFFLIILGIYCYRHNKVIAVKPWVTGLSGQLQKAFVTDMVPARIAGVLKLKRSELQTACEDFSNVIGSSSIGTIYKGTHSSGAEIAVASIAVLKALDSWSTNIEAQFRKKIETLSRINHKNFVNLVGYCEEDNPFTRVIVFEYAPNGTLFEHLHVKEAEHLDWGMRMRIAMGIAYCLEHMHQLNPPIPHGNLNSSSIMLTEDYAAKVSDFIFWNQIAAAEIENKGIELLETNPTVGPERNVYSFGVVLFEMVTARLPYSVDNGSLDDWASDYVRGERPLRHMVDPALGSYDVDQVEEIGRVIKSCVHPSPDHRPTMREVCERLRGILGIPPDGAATKFSSLWWAELEIMSTEGA